MGRERREYGGAHETWARMCCRQQDTQAGKNEKGLQVPEPEGNRVGQLTVDRTQSGHTAGSRGGYHFPGAQRRKRPTGLEDCAQPALEE